MSRLSDLLVAIGGQLRALKDETDAKVFTEVRVELDRFDLSDLLEDSTRAPTARVCFMRAKPVKGPGADLDLDVSVAIVVVAGRIGPASPDFSSADLAALGLLDACARSLMLDPYVGLTSLTAADLGDQLVAVSEQSNKRAVAIALMEVKWRLLQALLARPAVQAGLGNAALDLPPAGYQVNDGEVVPLPEASP
ncbi:hypothetical protein [Bosea minatitlanensis]|uniref:Uncharacterized protein n=1 Tax=Bosea minatitlanensis TaxID=128782 RepID=A0ABW0F1E0_9HYPH|nr:hypothetical protein [Bosea minatitlanensis]MCT4491805.1 hypothetical protein [Bosea minatitlanensis]